MINIDQLKTDLDQQFLNKHLKEIRLITANIFLFIFQENKDKVLLISLMATSFCVYPLDYQDFMSELEKTNNNEFKKYLLGSKLDEISIMNNQTLAFNFHKRGPLFTPMTFSLILELKLHNTNLIIIDDELVVYALKTYDLVSKRPLLMKMAYVPLSSNDLLKQSDFTNSINEYQHHLFDIYIQTKTKPYIKLFNKRLALLKRKLIALNEDLNNWQTLVNQRHLYEKLLTHPSLRERLEEVKVDETIINLDKRYSLIDNIQLLFKKYKKGKKAFGVVENQIALCNDEINLINSLINNLPRTIMEADYLIEVAQNLKLVKANPKIEQKQIAKQRPYQISINETIYLFGKTAIQNDYLSFKIAQKDDYFFHIENYPGAHVICKSKQLNDQQRLTAASICLILSKKDQALITYTKVSNIKKGSIKGQVYLKQGHTIKLNQIDQAVINHIKSATKI